MSPRVLRALRFAAVAIGALFLAWLLFAWLAFEPLLKWALPRHFAQHGGYVLSIGQARLHPLRLAAEVREVSLREPGGATLLMLARLALDFDAGSPFKRAWSFDEVRLEAPVASLELRPDGRLNWLELVAALADPAAAPAQRGGPPPRVLVQRLAVTDGALDLTDRHVSGGFHTRADALALELHRLSTLPDDRGDHTLSVQTGLGGIVKWRGEFGLNPVQANGVVSMEGLRLERVWPYLRASLPLEAPQGEVALQLAYRLRHAEGRWQVELDDVAARAAGLALTDPRFAAPLTAALAQARLGLRARAQFGGGSAASFEVEGLKAALEGLTLVSAGEREPWFSLASAALDDARIASGGRGLAAGVLALQGGRLRVQRDAAGRVDLVERLARRGDAAAGAAPKRTTPAPDAAPKPAAPAAGAWPLRLAALRLQDFAIALEDAGVKPPLALALTDLHAEATGLSHDLAAAVPVSLSLRVDRGGRFEARGRVVPGAPSADLQLALNDLSLVPAQPFVARATTLKLAGGRASTQGRLRVDPAGWRYEGSADVRGVRLDEAATGERFLSWDRLHAPRLAVDARGTRIGELRAEGLGAKLVIARDRSVNVAQVMRPAAARPAAPARTKSATDQGEPPYALAIDRIRIAGGSVDFADLSLALPFGTRIHRLQGQVAGLSTRGTAPAQVALDGQVDDWGSARAAGQLRLFDPAAFTDLKVEFRNVEMAHLTPYSATFAGRRIASGKLSLDLEYRVQERRLVGENQVVMDQLTLGERVASPTALDLPLDLAIAILQDANGRIDLGIPVSGSLDDPQFSVGQLVWKAIANVLTRIVTAPFRALGALLGGAAGGADAQGLDTVAFDPGRSELLPPEREKLARLATALARRPALAVSVQPRFDPEADAQALRERALRAAVARAAGRAVAEGEEAGPLSTADPATRRALEPLFAQRFGADALRTLRQHHAQANPGAAAGDGAGQALSRLGAVLRPAPPLAPEEAQRLRGAELHALMLQRLVQAQPVDEAALRALAQARGTAIQADLAARGVAPPRLQVAGAQAAAASDGRSVRSTLALAAAPRSAPASAPPAAAAGSAPPGDARP